MVASEAVPFAKSGGLADVAGRMLRVGRDHEFLADPRMVDLAGHLELHASFRDHDQFIHRVGEVLPALAGGIDPEVARSVFDPFFSTREGGVGLGLSIVARLLEVAGGDIRLDSDHDGGARWLVTLPREPAAAAQASAPHSPRE